MNLVNFNALTAGVLFLASAANQEAVCREVLMDSTLTLLSFAGAIGGGFMALAFFPEKVKGDRGTSLRTDATRWLACSIFGGVFGPFACEFLLPKQGLPVTTSTALATSAFLGLFAWVLVHGVRKFIARKIKGSAQDANTK